MLEEVKEKKYQSYYKDFHFTPLPFGWRVAEMILSNSKIEAMDIDKGTPHKDLAKAIADKVSTSYPNISDDPKVDTKAKDTAGLIISAFKNHCALVSVENLLKCIDIETGKLPGKRVVNPGEHTGGCTLTDKDARAKRLRNIIKNGTRTGLPKDTHVAHAGKENKTLTGEKAPAEHLRKIIKNSKRTGLPKDTHVTHAGEEHKHAEQSMNGQQQQATTTIIPITATSSSQTITSRAANKPRLPPAVREPRIFSSGTLVSPLTEESGFKR